MIEEIKDIIISSRNKIAYEVNNTMLLAYWMLVELLLRTSKMEILKLNMVNKS